MGLYGSPENQPNTRIEVCPNCGKKNDNDRNYCSVCGYNFYSINSDYTPIKNNNSKPSKRRGVWSAGKITISIISIVFGFFAFLSSFSRPFILASLFCGIFMISGGIVSLSSKNAKNKSGSISATILYFFGALFTLVFIKKSPDSIVLGAISFAFGLFNLGSAIIIGKNENNKSIRRIVFAIVLSLSIVAYLTALEYRLDNTITKPDDKKEITEKSSVVETSPDNKYEYSLGDTFIFDNLELTLMNDVSYTRVSNMFSKYDGQKVIQIPVVVKNMKNTNHSLNMFDIKWFGSKGVELENMEFYFDDSISHAGDLQPGSTYTKYFYVLYDGNGQYTLELDSFIEKKTVKFIISE